MITRTKYINSSEIGVYASLTNKYCIIGPGGPYNFISSFTSQLGYGFPVIETTIASTNLIGTLVKGNSKGLLVPSTIEDYEMKTLIEN